MSVYYFDVKDGITVRDRIGLECGSDFAAVERGKIIALEVIEGLKDPNPNLHIVVIHESGREIVRIPAHAATILNQIDCT